MKILVTTHAIEEDKWLSHCIQRAKLYSPYPIAKILQANFGTDETTTAINKGIPVVSVGTLSARELHNRELRNQGVDWPTYEHACLLERAIGLADVPCLIIHSDTIFIRPVEDFVEANPGDFAVNSNFILLRNYENRQNLAFLKKDATDFLRAFPFRANAKSDPFVHLGRRHSRLGPVEAEASLETLLAFYGITKEALTG